LSTDVCRDKHDAHQFIPQVNKLRENVLFPKETKIGVDCAYSDGENIKYAEDGGFGFVCAFAGAGPGIRLHGAESQKGMRALVTFYNQGIKKKNLPFYFKERLRMRDKMSSPEGRRIYNMRKTGLEPVYGNLKANLCFREFLLRGLEKSGSR